MVKNLVTMSDLSKEEVYELIERGLQLKNGAKALERKDLFVANLFFENSTRTKHSFEVAQKKLALNLINFEASTSSVNKGETLYDTCKTLEMLGIKILVIRHPEREYYKKLSTLNIPIISGGDGSGEHPSQCLLDLMTIYERFGKIEGLNIVIVGDIKNSRVARSNYNILTRLGAKVRFICPDIFADETLGQRVEFDEVISEIDVCMLLRVQHERHDGSAIFDKEDFHKNYGLNKERYVKLKDYAIVMHPAPVNRGVEIADELVEADKSVIFEQMRNGMFMRQAILEKIIKDNNL
ncbi:MULTISPECIES: aspartate carbamoyltransferase catalytic subunit [unclassified Gemella]|uniref:aspartate carbamoyltransferase catalytic subunit n=1 Tax=unclassified Gemella TaxID=2624949 RepID=UPI001073FBDD|nr:MULTISPECIES: aspartate carbamoyltransferase catalytic subunit [unclassified Gemella]MBF0710431.1 aspartate carbamoyltransferase catalytic subunit [Gemella sp. GL1.1]MBF0747069.1 aspartate carbamoyltransferase catalytic subunit [Gemella sp. 19428wG2_WT2a]NYS27775.1 aspartate carbamoyltransferase catalytic subunit [Gemella sp. GL1]TFU58560.1 aspartate carbamoyltransferase catalytic subunit [Gemella sp. WT2a]